MGDLITSILGRKHCGWCFDKPPDFFCRLYGADGFVGDQVGKPLYQRMYIKAYWKWSTFNTEILNIWRLGRRWHFRFHASAKDRRRYFHGEE